MCYPPAKMKVQKTCLRSEKMAINLKVDKVLTEVLNLQDIRPGVPIRHGRYVENWYKLM